MRQRSELPSRGMDLIPAGTQVCDATSSAKTNFTLGREEDERPCRHFALSTLRPTAGKENAVRTSNLNSAVLLVVLTLMTLVQTRLLFARDRAVDQRILAEVTRELGKE